MAYTEILKQAHVFYEEIAANVIEDIKKLDYDSHSQAPADLGLLTLWDDFKEQVQNGQSEFYEVYTATFEQFIASALKEGYIEWEILVMWLACEAADSHEIRDGLWWDDVSEGIRRAVLSEMTRRAEDEAIEYRAGYGPDGETDDDEEDEEENEVDEQLELF